MIFTSHPKSKFSAQGEFICPRGTKAGDGGQERREREQGREVRDFCSGGTKECLWIERRQIAVYKRPKRTGVRMS